VIRLNLLSIQFKFVLRGLFARRNVLANTIFLIDILILIREYLLLVHPQALLVVHCTTEPHSLSAVQNGSKG